MKIKSIEINNSEIFSKNFKINFTNCNTGPSIHYLVGNNGNGKTKILEIIYNFMLDQFPNFDLDISYISEGIDKEFKYENNSIVNRPEEQNKKVVFSSVEVNFNDFQVEHPNRNPGIDTEKPKERSQDLNRVIPQMLADIKIQDNKRIFDHAKVNDINEDNRKKLFNDLCILERFKSAYNEIFDEKEFVDVKEDFTIIFYDKKQKKELNLNNLSSGEKQIIYRLGYILKNLGTIDDCVVLIDEPEISLHPKWQIKFKELLLKIFDNKNVQIIVATHSPYIFNNLDSEKEECVLIDKNKNETTKIELKINKLTKSPSSNLVNYLAFKIPTRELHIELYDALIEAGIISDDQKKDIKKLKDIGNKEMSFTRTVKYYNEEPGTVVSEPLTIYVRNGIHHPKETARKVEENLEESINFMLEILK